MEERWWRGLVRLVALQSVARKESKACSCVACRAEALKAAMAQLAVQIAVGRLAFQARGGLCRGHESARVRVHVLVCQGHARAGSPRHAGLGYSATEQRKVCWRRTGAEDVRKIRGAALQCVQGSRCRAVVCCACMCGLLREAASWPDGHLSCQSVRVLLWIVCLSVVRWVPW